MTGIRDMKRRQFPMAYARKPGPLIGCAVQGSPSFGLSRRPERTGCRTFLDKRKAGCPWHPAQAADKVRGAGGSSPCRGLGQSPKALCRSIFRERCERPKDARNAALSKTRGFSTVRAGCPWHPARVAASEEAQGRRSARTRFMPGSPVSFLQRKAYRFLKKSMVLL